MKKYFVLFLSIIIFAGTIYGTTTVQNIQASLHKDMNIELNGKKLELKDSSKKALYPIYFEGHTYLPVETLASSMNLDMKWDEKSKTIKLENKKDKTTIQQTSNANSVSPTQEKGKIKGNKKSKIYHLPHNVSYDKIKEENVVYFNTEEEAVKAGYRKAKK